MDAGDVVRYWPHPVIAGVELMHARFVRHAYARHSHDTFAIGVTEVGTAAHVRDAVELIRSAVRD